MELLHALGYTVFIAGWSVVSPGLLMVLTGGEGTMFLGDKLRVVWSVDGLQEIIMLVYHMAKVIELVNFNPTFSAKW